MGILQGVQQPQITSQVSHIGRRYTFQPSPPTGVFLYAIKTDKSALLLLRLSKATQGRPKLYKGNKVITTYFLAYSYVPPLFCLDNKQVGAHSLPLRHTHMLICEHNLYSLNSWCLFNFILIIPRCLKPCREGCLLQPAHKQVNILRWAECAQVS